MKVRDVSWAWGSRSAAPHSILPTPSVHQLTPPYTPASAVNVVRGLSGLVEQKRLSLSDIPQVHGSELLLLRRGANKRHVQTCSIAAEETAHDEFFEPH